MKAGIRVAAMLIALFVVGCASRPPLATVLACVVLPVIAFNFVFA